MKRRNKYDFKWWHGVLGLVGLGMVLGTVQFVAATRALNAEGPGVMHRGFEIRVQPADTGAGYMWIVLDENGAFVGESTTPSATEQLAALGARAAIDTLLSNASVPEMNGRRHASMLRSPPLIDIDAHQTRWERFKR